MTGDEHGTTVSDARVRAAAERWARAAGVPLEAAHGSAPHRSPGPLRFLRGAVLGAVLGLVLLLLARGTGITAVLGVVLAVAGCVLAGRLTAQRRQRVPGRTAPSRG